MLNGSCERVSTSLLAVALEVAPPSVTEMLQRLARRGLVDYTPYHGAALTEAGQSVALAVLRRRRLLKQFLSATLGYGWDEVETEAHTLEHVASGRFLARIDALLGYPTSDPHGDPIPRCDGTLPPCTGQPLTEIPPATMAHVVRVTDQRPNRLRYLVEIGLHLGAALTVRARAPFDGPLMVAVGKTLHTLDSTLACTIWVQPVQPDERASMEPTAAVTSSVPA